MSDPSENIIERMGRIRSRRSERVAEISSEAERLTDWKEYVRSAPMTAFMMSITIGAIGTRALFGGSGNRVGSPDKNSVASATHSSLAESSSAPSKGVVTKLLSTILSLAMPIIINTARSQISRTVSNFQSDGVRTHGK